MFTVLLYVLSYVFQISFVRRRDFHILSNGHTLFTSDPRFEIVHRAKTIDWILRLRGAQFQDAGKYECQVCYCITFFQAKVCKIIEPVFTKLAHTKQRAQLTCLDAELF